MPTPLAEASDVRTEINTVLDDETIEGVDGDADDNGILGRVTRDIFREYDTDDFEDDQHRKDLEASLAALRIATGQDRRAQSVTTGRTSKTYEASEVNRLRATVRRVDPGDAFAAGGVRRNTDRHVRSVGDSS